MSTTDHPPVLPGQSSPFTALAALAQRAASACDLATATSSGRPRAWLDDLLDHVVAVLASEMGATHVGVFEAFAEDGYLRSRAGVLNGSAVPRAVAGALRLPTGRDSLPGYTLAVGSTVVAADLLADPRFMALAPAFGVGARSALCVPIGPSVEPWGVLGIYRDQPHQWTEPEVTFAEGVSGIVGLAVRATATALAASQADALAQMTAEVAGFGRWRWNLATGEIHLDGAAAQLMGVTPGPGSTGDLRPVDIEQFATAVHPEDQARLLSALAADPAAPGGPAGSADSSGSAGSSGSADSTGSAGSTGSAESAGGAGQAGWRRESFRVVRDASPDRWVEVVAMIDTSDNHWASAVDESTEHANRGWSSGVMHGVVLDLTRDLRGREARLAAERTARHRAESTGARLATISEASALFGQFLDPAAVLNALAEFCVPSLGDLCRIDLPDRRGRLVAKVVRGGSAHQRRALEESAPDRWTTATGEARPTSARPSSARPTSDRPRSDRPRSDRPTSARADTIGVDALADATAMVVPLTVRGRVAASLTLVVTGSRPLGVEQRALVEELAGRAALALDNSHQFQARNRLLSTLQHTLVPPTLPRPGPMVWAARYRAADPHVEVGGDFYDLIELDDGTWGAVVGDVCGRGNKAAALTGLVRHTVRSAALADPRPTSVLSHTNRVVINQLDDFRFCTATYLHARPTPTGVAVAVASAGHPRSVLVRRHGAADLLSTGGVPLGVVATPDLSELEVVLRPGDALVIYTDGVTEARGRADMFGDDRLLAVLASAAGTAADSIAGALEQAVMAHHPESSDDMAILVLQAAGEGERLSD